MFRETEEPHLSKAVVLSYLRFELTIEVREVIRQIRLLLFIGQVSLIIYLTIEQLVNRHLFGRCDMKLNPFPDVIWENPLPLRLAPFSLLW